MAARQYDHLELEYELEASPQAIYDAWLSGEAHAEMTDGGPADASAEVGAAFSAWDGYITGTNLELVPQQRIVQSWRTSEFDDADEDSRLEITLHPSGKGTRIHLLHTHIPQGQGPSYEKGWMEYYFLPMESYFAR